MHTECFASIELGLAGVRGQMQVTSKMEISSHVLANGGGDSEVKQVSLLGSHWSGASPGTPDPRDTNR